MATQDFAGKTYFVTGTNTGIGRATVEALAAGGGRVVLAGRSQERTQPVLDEIRQRYPASDPFFLQIDLSDLASVRRAAESFLLSGRPLDVLINNAGAAGKGGRTPDGFEWTVATNHLGPFLLTELLRPRLEAAPQGRIVNVSSHAHRNVKRLDWEAYTQPTPAGKSFAMYRVTKLMNVLHAKELARRLAGTRVTTYALHPGVVKSDIWREIREPIRSIMKFFMTTNEKGARTSVYCATAPELATTTGRYYNNRREAAPSRVAEDAALARELFAWSERAVGRAPGA